MRRVNTFYPLHVLITNDVHEAAIEILRQLNVTYSYVSTIPTPPDIYAHNIAFEPNTAATWRNCWTKLHIFNQTQYDKLVFLDADIMILKNLDHLFNYPHMTSALDGEYFNLWPDWPHFNSGCIIIKPSNELFENILTFANNLKESEIPEYIIADQEILNLYFSDWPEHKELHLNKYYDIFGPYILEEQIPEVNEKCYFIHYVGRKPWTFWLRGDNEYYTEYYYAMAKEMVETQLRQFDWDRICSYVIVTVYAICKNEIDNVPKWLNSFGEADYVCILDTGSTDGTWELLQEEQKSRPNLIISQQTVVPWRYDEARNLSMTLIPKETTMYFMADLDEIIKESGWCNIVKSTWNPLFDRGIYTYNRDVGENDVIIRQIPEYRIHSSNWYKWVNIVHEALVNYAGRKQFYIETCTEIPITVWHYPREQKITNYMELCEDDLLENPDDYVMRLQLAIEYEIRDMKDKAAEHYQYLLDDPGNLQDFELARCYYSLGKYYNDVQYFMTGQQISPNTLDNYIAEAEMLYQNKQYDVIIPLMKRGFSKVDSAKWCTMYDANSYYAYWILGMSYYQLDDKIQALAYITIAADRNPSKEYINLRQAILEEAVEKIKKGETI